MANKKLCVAVWMVTYNHAKYVEQAIESVVNQKANFDFKLFISDDNSKDGTNDICKALESKYPDKIELVVNENNIGPQANALNTYDRCFKSGAKYVALLEGDDYWSDEKKLQTQVDVLNANSKYVGCFHNTEERFESNSSRASFLYVNYPSATIVTFSDLSYRNLIPTCSILFRNNLFGDFPDWYKKLKMGDWPLHLLNAQFGDFWYIPKVMGVHRLHNESIWMLQDAERNIQFVIEAYDHMIGGFASKPQLADQLRIGKKVFVEAQRCPKQKPGFKKKIKSLMVRAIEKL
ncbi:MULTISPECIES: glycosyltransferase [Niastella]|uniref:Glycosyltransferase n=1 Tax=Niastella soli TaxID=2821487 RepID=A0ABS3YQS0_9BACT|nr:glycosyltransferase [Niastella soli]MBO9200143.1 glycosyltransferase [Niastella soli]